MSLCYTSAVVKRKHNHPMRGAVGKIVCVYCSSSEAVPTPYFRAARDVGAHLARRGDTLVYGGGKVGLMGALAKAVHEHGGTVIGVIPESLRDMERAYTEADELIITKDLRERKAIMETHSDAFVALPGGYGTLEEMLEMLTLKQLQYHAKPLVFLNADHFYDPLLALFEHMYEQRFAKRHSQRLYYVAPTAQAVFHYLDTYQPEPAETKWF